MEVRHSERCVPVREHSVETQFLQPLQSAAEVDDPIGPIAVARDVTAMDDVHHRTPRCEVEGHVVSDNAPGLDGDAPGRP